MKKKLLSGLGLLSGLCLQAQVAMTLQLPPLGLTIKPQLWNMSVVNGTGAPMYVQLQMTMSDAGTNQPVLTAASSHFTIQTGASMLTANSVAPVMYTAGAGYAVDPGPNGFLPVGVFNVCYTLTRWTNDIDEQLAEECITVEVEPVSPPQLILPEDSARLYFKRPFFTWLPPAPVNAYGNLQYDLVLVEVPATQTASEAIQQNMPVFNQPNVSFTALQYPLSMPELDTGKVYAWRVTAKNNGMSVANSEIWSFRVEENAIDSPAVSSTGYFARLHRQEDAAFVLCKGVLRFEYKHDVNTSDVGISIFDISRQDRKPVKWNDDKQPVHFGQNFITLDLHETPGMIDKHIYLLELTDDRNDRWYLKFEYRKD